MMTAVKLADAALQAAKDHSAAQRSARASQSLIVNTALLIAAIVLTGAAMLAVSRRVITPLHRIRDAMLKVAGGDLAVDSGYLDRHDEIGSLAGALETFKQQAIDKLKIEEQERERNAGAAARQRAIETYVGEFEGVVRKSLGELSDASGRDAQDLGRSLRRVTPDQRARRGRRQGLQRRLDQRRERRGRRRGARAPRSTTSASRPRTPRASPAAPSTRPARPTAPCRDWRNPQAASARSSA